MPAGNYLKCLRNFRTERIISRRIFPMTPLALAFALILVQRPELAPPPPPVIVVTGSAQIMAMPDEATVRLGIVRQAPVAQTAQEQANAVAQDILNAVLKAG